MENKDVMYHLNLRKEDLKGAKYAILPGDPGRVPRIASYLNNPVHIKTNREYTSYLGELDGEQVLVMSTGMGGPSTAIAIEELNLLGVKYLIRVGTSGGMQLNVDAGDLNITNTVEKKIFKVLTDAIEGSELSNEDKIYLLKEIEKRLSV